MWTYIANACIVLALIGIVALIVVSMVRNKRRGKTSCGIKNRFSSEIPFPPYESSDRKAKAFRSPIFAVNALFPLGFTAAEFLAAVAV